MLKISPLSPPPTIARNVKLSRPYSLNRVKLNLTKLQTEARIAELSQGDLVNVFVASVCV